LSRTNKKNTIVGKGAEARKVEYPRTERSSNPQTKTHWFWESTKFENRSDEGNKGCKKKTKEKTNKRGRTV